MATSRQVFQNASASVQTRWKRFWLDAKGNAKLKLLLNSRLFWGVLAIKFGFGCLFASNYLLGLFVPFLDYFSDHPFNNPYAYFWAIGEGRLFPYPAAMLYGMGVPFLLVKAVVGKNLSAFAMIALARLPLLLADTTIMFILARWHRARLSKILLYYWCSPVLFYITYIHGQLDVLPLAILFVSFYFLTCEKLAFAAFCLGLALATKTHLFLVVPFFLLYLWRRGEAGTAVLRYAAIIFVAFALPNLPYLRDPGFLNMVLNNPEQHKLFQAAIPFSGSVSYYVIPAVYLVLFFGASAVILQSRDLFLNFLGFSFSAIVFFIPPMQGWYYWVVPFLAHFYAKQPGKIALFVGLQASYFLFFALIPNSDYAQVAGLVFPSLAKAPTLYAVLNEKGLSGEVALNAAFTLMQTLLLLNSLWIYRKGVKGLQKRRLFSLPFLLGISGNSGSGKTTLAQNLIELFTPSYATALCGDDMHKWQRGHDKWKEMTPLDPRANELHREFQMLRELRRHKAVMRRHYDHQTGMFTQERVIQATPLMLYEGLHSFYLSPTNDIFDLKIFVSPDEELWLHYKIARDIVKRNYTREQVLASLNQRKSDAEKYILGQKNMADIVISFRLAKPLGDRVGLLETVPEVYLQMRFANKFYLEPLIEPLRNALGNSVSHDFDETGVQVVEIRQQVSVDLLAWLGEKYVLGFQDIGIYDPQWQSGWNGLVQLFVVYCLFYEVQIVSQD